MKLILASEVPSDQLSEFLGRVPEGEQAFLKENVPRSRTRRSLARPPADYGANQERCHEAWCT